MARLYIFLIFAILFEPQITSHKSQITSHKSLNNEKPPTHPLRPAHRLDCGDGGHRRGNGPRQRIRAEPRLWLLVVRHPVGVAGRRTGGHDDHAQKLATAGCLRPALFRVAHPARRPADDAHRAARRDDALPREGRQPVQRREAWGRPRGGTSLLAHPRPLRGGDLPGHPHADGLRELSPDFRQRHGRRGKNLDEQHPEASPLPLLPERLRRRGQLGAFRRARPLGRRGDLRGLPPAVRRADRALLRA